MAENFHFHVIKKQLLEKKSTETQLPLTANEHKNPDEEPMGLKDTWQTVRYSIQEKLPVEKPSATDQKMIKQLKELISPDLVKDHQEILAYLRKKTNITDDHPRREFIDIDDEKQFQQINEWIDKLLNDIEKQKGAGLDIQDIDELRVQCWLYFDALINVMNTRSLEKDIVEYYANQTDDTPKEKKTDDKSVLLNELQTRYPFNRQEIEVLYDLVQSENDDDEKYSLRILAETTARLWKEYNLGSRKGSLAKISLGYLLSKGISSYSPSMFQNIIKDDTFNAMVFIEFLGLNKIADLIETQADFELSRMMNEIEHQINERIVNSLFFQEFEFIHERSLGEIYSTLESGKGATANLIREIYSDFLPTLSGIIMSLAFLTKISPALGGIGLCSMPVMYKIARKQNQQVWPLYQKEMREHENIETHLGSIKSGFEEVKTSADTPEIAKKMKDQLNSLDTLSMQRQIKQQKMQLKRRIPFEMSQVVAAAVGGALQQAGMITGGGIMSNIIYSQQLDGTINRLVNLYFNNFSRLIQNIQRMETILGKYEELDLPEGGKEKQRHPVSGLKNLDISIEGLHYKDVLKGISLQIKQGEFVTIAGESGVGKSTLLRNLVGLYKPDKGVIKIGGTSNDQIKKYGDESLYSVISYCNQSPQIFDGMTFRENLLLWSKKDVPDKTIRKILADLHLEKFADRLDEDIRHFSGGEKVRIGVARTLLKGAKIMLLDEPTASLDSQASAEVRKILLEINGKYPDTTIICVSHDEKLIKNSQRSINLADLQNG